MEIGRGTDRQGERGGGGDRERERERGGGRGRQARTHWVQDRFTETSVETGRGTDRQGERGGGGREDRERGGRERTAGEDALDTGQVH